MRIALVISSLGGGGAERVMATLANAWARDGVAVTLITLADRAQDVYPLADAVERVDLDLTGHSPGILHALSRNVVRLRRLRAALVSCGPDVVISFMTTTNLLAIMACLGLRCPVLVSERVFVSLHPARGIWRHLYRPLYRRAAAVVAQTRRGATELEALLKRAVTVIPNPLPAASPAPAHQQPSMSVLPRHTGDVCWLLAVGRLNAQKGFDLLIAAFARVAADHPQWHLIIAGEGSERAALMAQISRLGLTGRIHLPGFYEHPQDLMRQADLFVLSSRYEGMPNALLEAMATGCACISFDCKTGPAELIEHGVNGWLVAAEDTHALTAALQHLMPDRGLRVRLGAAARAVAEKFTVNVVLAQWDALIATAIDSKSVPATRANRKREATQ